MTPIERGMLEKYLDGWKDHLKEVIIILGIDKGELAVRGFLAGALMTVLLSLRAFSGEAELKQEDFNELGEIINLRLKDFFFEL